MQTETGIIVAVINQVTLGMFQSLDWLCSGTFEKAGKAIAVRRGTVGLFIPLDNGEYVSWECSDAIADAVCEHFAGLTAVPANESGNIVLQFGTGKSNPVIVTITHIGSDFVPLRQAVTWAGKWTEPVFVSEYRWYPTVIKIGISRCEIWLSHTGVCVRTKRKFVVV